MKTSLLFVIGGTMGVGLALYGRSPQAAEARAELVDGQGKPVGVAEFREESRGVLISLKLTGLPPGTHALHIHAKGVCDGPDFKGAGDHFNPFQRKHGWLNPEGPHAGDLPNITVDENGAFSGSFLAPLVTLGPGSHSLFAGPGTCLMIHQGPDDGHSDPSGNSGARIACGVIRR